MSIAVLRTDQKCQEVPDQLEIGKVEIKSVLDSAMSIHLFNLNKRQEKKSAMHHLFCGYVSFKPVVHPEGGRVGQSNWIVFGKQRSINYAKET